MWAGAVHGGRCSTCGQLMSDSFEGPFMVEPKDMSDVCVYEALPSFVAERNCKGKRRQAVVFMLKAKTELRCEGSAAVHSWQSASRRGPGRG